MEQKPGRFAGGSVDEHALETNTSGGPFAELGLTLEAITEYGLKIEINPLYG